jgi:hypothetical protein
MANDFDGSCGCPEAWLLLEDCAPDAPFEVSERTASKSSARFGETPPSFCGRTFASLDVPAASIVIFLNLSISPRRVARALSSKRCHPSLGVHEDAQGDLKFARLLHADAGGLAVIIVPTKRNAFCNADHRRSRPGRWYFEPADVRPYCLCAARPAPVTCVTSFRPPIGYGSRPRQQEALKEALKGSMT